MLRSHSHGGEEEVSEEEAASYSRCVWRECCPYLRVVQYSRVSALRSSL